MNDYLAKPVSGARLAEMLARHLGAGAGSGAGTAAAPFEAAAPAVIPVFDAAVLGSLPMVIDGSKPKYAISVLEHFRQHSIDTLDQFERATASADEATRMRCIHNLKSSSAQVGLLALAAVAEYLEGGMREGLAPDADGMLRLYTEHRRALEAIAEYST
jgi:HPt (histidine-containing phosphotransfer) domain-containing protein